MRALVFTGPSVVEMLDVDQPDVGDGEVLVTMEAAGICGSELHGIRTPGFRQPPLIMGHEFVGRTDDGRRVAINPLLPCDECDLCLLGRPQLCRSRCILGIHRAGGFAQQVSVPSRLLHELPQDLTWEQAAMAEPLANAVHAWHLAAPAPGSRVGVIGGGTIGLVCLLTGIDRGGHEIVVAEPSEERRRVAAALGADSVVASLDGEFDVVFDAVGAAVTRHSAVSVLRPGGTTVWLGLMSDDPGFAGNDLVRQEKRVQGSFAYLDSEFAEALELSRRCDLSWVSSVPLEDGASTFTELMNGRTDLVKVLLRG